MRKNLYLILATICFIALISIIVSGGYMGVFDTLYITSRTDQLVLGTAELMQPEATLPYNYMPARQITRGTKTSFTYELENRRFSPYEARVEVTFWGDSQPGPLLLLSQDINIEPFKKVKMEWKIDPQDLNSRGFQAGLYTLRVNRGGVERRIIMSYTSFPAKPYPVPVPVPPR
jgi:hypothetical protein